MTIIVHLWMHSFSLVSFGSYLRCFQLFTITNAVAVSIPQSPLMRFSHVSTSYDEVLEMEL